MYNGKENLCAILPPTQLWEWHAKIRNATSAMFTALVFAHNDFSGFFFVHIPFFVVHLMPFQLHFFVFCIFILNVLKSKVGYSYTFYTHTNSFLFNGSKSLVFIKKADVNVNYAMRNWNTQAFFVFFFSSFVYRATISDCCTRVAFLLNDVIVQVRDI